MRTTQWLTLGVLLVVLGVGASSAVATPAQSTGTRFLIQYKASIVGDWSITTGPGTRCPETNHMEQSGTFASSVKNTSRKYLVDVYKPFTSIYWDYTPKRSVDIKGIVTSERTAQGWFRKYCDAPPRSRQDIVTLDNSGCTAETFPGFVGLYSVRGYRHDGKPEPVFFSWEWEREPLNCQTGSMWRGIDPQEQVSRPLDFKKLYRCGIKKPRGCRLTIGGAKSFSYSADTKGVGYPVREGITEYRGKSRLEWSVTFVAIGRSPS